MPLCILIYLIIKFETPGPIIFKRRIIGKGGRPFDAYKFRTMVDHAEEILSQNVLMKKQFRKKFKLMDDPRITKFGYYLRKFSLDEIPQLINILKGEMSLIGPRMMTKEELERYGRFRSKILSMKPGLSGLWQISGRQDLSYKLRIRFDIYYINNWSIWMDLYIILKTFYVVLATKGAY